MDLNNLKFLIVGAGFFGSVIAERIANILGEQVIIIDKRNHIGGNCYSETYKDTTIEYHKYGTHIFHTSNREAWKYVNQFTEFNGYYHQVLTTFRDKVYQMPINIETINSFYNVNLKPCEVDEFLFKKKKDFMLSPKNFEEKAISWMKQNPVKTIIITFKKIPYLFMYDGVQIESAFNKHNPIDNFNITSILSKFSKGYVSWIILINQIFYLILLLLIIKGIYYLLKNKNYETLLLLLSVPILILIITLSATGSGRYHYVILIGSYPLIFFGLKRNNNQC